MIDIEHGGVGEVARGGPLHYSLVLLLQIRLPRVVKVGVQLVQHRAKLLRLNVRASTALDEIEKGVVYENVLILK